MVWISRLIKINAKVGVASLAAANKFAAASSTALPFRENG